MTPLRLISALALTGALTGALVGCTSPVPDATRDLPINEATGHVLALGAASKPGTAPGGYSLMAPNYDVVAVNVLVPESLRVSEANLYYPIADIVWRGEPRGDRYQQVKAIFEEGFAAGTGTLNQGRAVVVDVVVDRFHILTEKARYTIGGVYSIKFTLTVRDAASGAVLDGPRVVVADVKAPGGAIAVQQEDMGITERSVILKRLTEVSLRELTRPLAVPVPNDGAPIIAAGLVPVTRSSFDPTELPN